MRYSKDQWIASIYNKNRSDNFYIRNKRGKGQKSFFECSCCKKKFDFENSDDYVGAVEQWEGFGGKCYACAKGFCPCKDRQ